MLKSFIYTAELKSLTKAAEVLLLPVSSVSRYISELEEALEYNLLNKTKGKISLTPNGERLYRQANKHLRALEKAMLNIEVEQEVIRFATYSSAVSYITPVLFKYMSVLMPDVRLEVSVLSKKECEEAISKDEIDIGLYAYYNGEKGYDKKADLMYNDIGPYIPVIAVAKDNPFNLRHTEGEILSIEYVLQQPELSGKFFHTSNFMFSELIQSKQKNRIVINASGGIDLLKQIIIKNNGFGMFDSQAVHDFERSLFRLYILGDAKDGRKFTCYKNQSQGLRMAINILKSINTKLK